MKKYFLLPFLVLVSFMLRAAHVDTVGIYSKAMKKEFKCVVIRPEKENNALPVVYLLHGYGGDYSNWIKFVPQLKTYADQYDILIVCPDGGHNSWYFDSPLMPQIKFETYISKEVPEFIDKNYPTVKSRKGRAITGLSMGGHGGLYIGLRNSDDFG